MNHVDNKRYSAIGTAVLFFVMICFAPALAAADRITEERSVDAFHSVDLRTVGSITLSQGDAHSLVIRGKASVLKKLNTEVRDGVLVISSKRPITTADTPEISIEMKTVRLLRISGSGDIEGTGRILSSDLNLAISGSGDMDLELKAEKLESKVSGSGDMSLDIEALTVMTKISGSGDVEMAGKAEELSVKISGSGTLEAHGLQTMNAAIRISGSGNCTVNVRDRLDVDISGSGDVVYAGNPKVNLSGSGSGSVRSQ
jgi:hypothetical protein